MSDKNPKKHIVHDILIFIGILVLLVFICRLWPIIFLIIIGIFISALRLLYLLVIQTEPQKNYPLLPEPQKEPDEEDIYRLAYTVILRRITELISADFPDASWTWEAPDAQREIRKGKDVSILLSKAGGYRRAVVIIRNATAVKVEYCEPDDKTSNSESETGLRENHEDNNTEMPNDTHIDYGLYAYEWVESHIFDLNDICNNAIGQGLSETVLSKDVLPAKESWKDISIELVRAGFKSAECIPEGIKINLKHLKCRKEIKE